MQHPTQRLKSLCHSNAPLPVTFESGVLNRRGTRDITGVAGRRRRRRQLEPSSIAFPSDVLKVGSGPYVRQLLRTKLQRGAWSVEQLVFLSVCFHTALKWRGVIVSKNLECQLRG